jgi:predicted nucleic acid-binding protein
LLAILNEPGVTVMVPEAVLAERSYLDPDDPAPATARSTDWIHVVPTPPIPDRLQPWKLGAGEKSVIALALAENEATPGDGNQVDVVLDDAKARRCAESLGVRVQGTLAFLLIAKTTGRIAAVHRCSNNFTPAECMFPTN